MRRPIEVGFGVETDGEPVKGRIDTAAEQMHGKEQEECI